jgi:hypothetical protein
MSPTASLTRDELRQELLRSKKFLEWLPAPPPKRKADLARGENFTYTGKKYTNLIVDEKHFTPADLAKAWGISAETIRVLFRDEPGVLKIGDEGTKYKRRYKTLRIPQSIAERVHRRLSA